MGARLCYRFLWRYLCVAVFFLGCAGPTETADPPERDVSEEPAGDASDSSGVEEDIGEEQSPLCAEATPCDDGDDCTANDQCDVEGECAGTPYSCDDGQECTFGSCDGEGGCGFEILEGYCYIGGACVQDGAQMPDSVCLGCDVAASQVGWSSLEGRVCDDGDLCTVDDRCSEGGCSSEVTLDCIDGNPCTDDACDPAAGCTFVQNSNPCDDGKADTRDDSCNAEGACEGVAFTCEEPGPCVETVVPNGKDCSYTYMLAGTACDDSVLNTRNDFCDGFGLCKGSEYSCDSSDDCLKSSEANGVDCTLVFEDAGSSCDDTKADTKDDVCDMAGVCQGTEFQCEPASSCVLSSIPNGEVCVDTYFAEATECNDEDMSTKNDLCDAGGSCIGVSFSCDSSDPCVASSDPNGWNCTIVWAGAEVSCDDGVNSTRNDFCDGAGGCMGESYSCDTTNPCVLTALPNGEDCNIVHKPEGTQCDDGSVETAGDQCTATGVCEGAPLNCDSTPECVVSSVPDGEQCVTVYMPSGTSCDDGNPDNLNDICNAIGVCSGAAPCVFDASVPGSPCAQPQCVAYPNSEACMNLSVQFCVDNAGAQGCTALFSCDFVPTNPGSPCADVNCLTDSNALACAAVADDYCQNYPEDAGCEEVISGLGACEFDADDASNPCLAPACETNAEGAECLEIVQAFCALNPNDPGCNKDVDGPDCSFSKTNPGSPCNAAECLIDITSDACLAVAVAYCQNYHDDPACEGGYDDSKADECMFFTDRPDSPCYDGAWVDVCTEHTEVCETFIADYCVNNSDDPGCDCGTGEGHSDDCVFEHDILGSPCFGGHWVDVCAAEGGDCEGFIAEYCEEHPEDGGCNSMDGSTEDVCPYNTLAADTPCDYPACLVDYTSSECAAYVAEYCASSDDPYCSAEP